MVYKYLKDEKGIALVIAMGFSVLIFASALALTYRLSSFIRTTRSSQIKSQNLYTTDVGLEELRHYFWSNYCSPPDWCSTGLGFGTLNQNTYTDITANLISSVLPNDQSVTLQGYTVQYTSGGQMNIMDGSNNIIDSYTNNVYLKDTPLENTVEVLSSSEQTSNQSKANTAAAIIFAIPCSDDYKQFGQCVGKEGSSGEAVGDTTMRTVF